MGCYPDKISGSVIDPSDPQNTNNINLKNTQTLINKQEQEQELENSQKKSLLNFSLNSKKIKNNSTGDPNMNFNNLTSAPIIVNSSSNTSLCLPSANSLNVSNSAELARKKNPLARGYSLMDWMRFAKETVDLAGNKGIMRQITYEELAKHDKEDDCWMAVYNKVYNVTPYMKYHPGGVDELMKGAGKNATDLFNQVHQWVNIQSMLEKCVIGNLVGLPVVPVVHVENDAKKSKENLSAKSSESLSSLKFIKEPAIELPVLDSYQSIQTCNIVLYTKIKNLTKECLIIDKSFDSRNPNFLSLFLNTTNAVYKYILEIPAPIQDNYEIKISKEGKVEICLTKVEKIHWWQMCPKLKFNAEIVQNSKTGVNYRECSVTKRINVTHDTDIYIFSLPDSSRMHVPIGQHVFLRLQNDDILTKPYTVIQESLLPNSEPNDGRQVCLMIKHYEDGALTPRLKQLDIGSKVELSNYTGSFQQETLLKCSELFLICAGSGFTPMARLLTSSIQIETINKIKMLFFNKTTKDIIWKQELEEIERKYPKFKLCNILSQAEADWTGKRGRIAGDLVKELIGKNAIKPLFCVCGPKQFTDLTKELLEKQEYAQDSIITFLG